MNKVPVWSGVACVSVFLATGALGEILGVQPGTSDNPKDNVPQEIQRSTPGRGSFGPGATGPGTRSDALTGGMEKEKPEFVTRQGLECCSDSMRRFGEATVIENFVTFQHLAFYKPPERR